MNWLAAGCAVVIAGVPFDLSGELLMITRATLPSLNSDEFIAVTSAYRWLGAAIANGLYCVGGWVLSYEAWRSGWLRGGVGVMGMAMWKIGLALTGTAVLDHHPAMIATGRRPDAAVRFVGSLRGLEAAGQRCQTYPSLTSRCNRFYIVATRLQAGLPAVRSDLGKGPGAQHDDVKLLNELL